MIKKMCQSFEVHIFGNWSEDWEGPGGRDYKGVIGKLWEWRRYAYYLYLW